MDELLRRFPALARLGRFGRARRIPIVRQLSATECGVACLAMVLQYHGKNEPLDKLRDAVGVSRDGASALGILGAARRFGLEGRGVKLEVEELEYLSAGAVLHWEFNHFVVFERVRPDGIEIVDPAHGRRLVRETELRRAFTGIALVLEPGETFEPGGTRSRPLVRYLRQTVRGSDAWLRMTVLSFLLQVFALSLPVLTSAIVDRVVPRGDHHLLTVLCAGLSSLLGFHFLASLVRSHLLLQLRTQLDLKMTLGFLQHLVGLPFSFFQRRQAGDLLMRLSSHATIREILTGSALSALLDGVLVTGYLGILFIVSAQMGLLVLALGALQIATFLLSRKRQGALLSEGLQIQARSEAYQVELVAGIETLKSLGAEERAVETWANLFVDTLNVSLKRGRLQALVEAFAGTLRLGSPLVILAWGAVKVLSGDLSLGAMLGLNALAAGFLGPLANLMNTATQLQLLGSYIERIDDVMAAEPEQPAERPRRRCDKLRGSVTLEKVSFRYSPLSPLVVDDVSLSIEPGQFVALVGPSGSGKSTLASLLVGLYQPSSGRVAYDGSDLNELELRALRRQMGIVVQRPYLFSTSVRANLSLADPSLSLDDVIAACKLAQIHDDIAAFPMAYDTLLVGSGSALSGGQRQRLALARALVHRPAILLLDEATSALDAVTERRVQDALSGLRCTRIVIAHRLSTVMQADRILVMVDGKIVEQGRHDELLARNGVYQQLVTAQLREGDDLPVAAAGGTS
jgi:ABC-type bacteriocin/lantibiotic exporter with double-glycine peptidase domain